MSVAISRKYHKYGGLVFQLVISFSLSLPTSGVLCAHESGSNVKPVRILKDLNKMF